MIFEFLSMVESQTDFFIWSDILYDWQDGHPKVCTVYLLDYQLDCLADMRIVAGMAGTPEEPHWGNWRNKKACLKAIFTNDV
jgi:hypothetical protein